MMERIRLDGQGARCEAVNQSCLAAAPLLVAADASLGTRAQPVVENVPVGAKLQMQDKNER
jgi:hypothetical protein